MLHSYRQDHPQVLFVSCSIELFCLVLVVSAFATIPCVGGPLRGGNAWHILGPTCDYGWFRSEARIPGKSFSFSSTRCFYLSIIYPAVSLCPTFDWSILKTRQGEYLRNSTPLSVSSLEVLALIPICRIGWIYCHLWYCHWRLRLSSKRAELILDVYYVMRALKCDGQRSCYTARCMYSRKILRMWQRECSLCQASERNDNKIAEYFQSH